MNQSTEPYEAETAAALARRRARDAEFYTRLEKLSRPFGLREILFSVGLGIAFMITAGAVGVLLSWLTR